jgi:phosphoribosyl 1,2-cyclic phosphate phosphodiesterase
MELLFLGTGAAEGSPAAYCRCTACQGVRSRGGVEVRTRSSLRVGAHHQIDIAPDHYAQVLRAGTDLYDVEHVLVTHSHEDHFTLTALIDKNMSQAVNGKPIQVHLSAPALAWAEGILRAMSLGEPDMRWIRANIHFNPLAYFHEYSIGGMAVRTVKGNHRAYGPDECSINYHITEPGGRRLLYACDTGFYREETWEYLAGLRVDTLVMECTFAGKTDRGEFPDGHLDLPSFWRMLDRMARIGLVDGSTAVYATHFNPHQGLDHFQIDERLRSGPRPAAAAHDGLRVEA